MITIEDVQKYVSFTEEVPDVCGKLPDGRYNTRFVGKWGVFAFLYLPADLAEALQEKTKKFRATDNACHKISDLHGDHEAFICNLKDGHEGLCVAASSDNTIVAVFVPVGGKEMAAMYAMIKRIERSIKGRDCKDD